jgi:hypothetical protein
MRQGGDERLHDSDGPFGAGKIPANKKLTKDEQKAVLQIQPFAGEIVRNVSNYQDTHGDCASCHTCGRNAIVGCCFSIQLKRSIREISAAFCTSLVSVKFRQTKKISRPKDAATPTLCSPIVSYFVVDAS